MACVILGCKSHSSRKENEAIQISFHRFPVDDTVKQMWIDSISRKNFNYKKATRICSKHFEDDCFININHKWRRLKPNAVPSLHLCPDINTTDESIPTPMETDDEVPATSSKMFEADTSKDTPAIHSPKPLLEQSNKNNDVLSTLTSVKANPAVPIDIDCVAPETSVRNRLLLQRRINKLEQALHKTKKISKARLLRINSLRQKARRLKKQKKDLNLRLLEILKEEKVGKDNILILDCVKKNSVVQKYLAKQQGNKTREFSPELKKFAVTLHFFSPRAYNFVRDELESVLPHPKTISRWYRGLNCNPGFTTESFESLKHRVELSDKPLYCALAIDEMAIRKLVEWNGREYFGYVNIGCDLDSDDVPLAREALTFMLTSVNDNWKIPVGYFLIKSITAQQKASLVKQCLILLENCGVKVVSLTFDGASTNKAMCTYLGCDLSVAPYFEQNGKTICIWPDPCHNIKLIRNCFADKLMMIDINGEKISWHYIEALNKIQNEEGIHLGTKLKNEHVNFIKQKMKVRLATQLLSASVADALEFCKDLGIPGFDDCAGTITFIRLFNNLFDVMNSRNMRAKGWKKALTTFNVDETKIFFNTAELYIQGLKFEDGTSVIHSNRSTGFRGFLICMKSLVHLYESLVAPDNSTLKYICTYKLSQDHIELFFGAIRSQCGFNNNPSARMFRAAYKKLLVHAQFKDSATGNCIPLERITVLNYSPEKYKQIINDSASGSRLVEVPELPDDENLDHDYILYPSSLSEYAHHVVHYIAGFVVRKLKKSLQCEKCVQSLETTVNSKLSLISIKDRGGLIKPSVDATKVCKAAEKILREYEIRVGPKHVGKPTYVIAMINKISLTLLCTNIFSDLFDHSLENELTEDHRNLLIKAISQAYLNVRIHHITKKITAPEEKVRTFLTKTVIFKGQ